MINESKNIKNESINQITRDNVLALDIASTVDITQPMNQEHGILPKEKAKMRPSNIKCFMTHWLNLSKNTTSN